MSITQIIKSDAPSLALLRKNNGDQIVNDALFAIVTDLVNYYNIGKTMNESQITQTVDLILAEYYYFKINDFKLCFSRSKVGRYGKVYDRIDGAVIFDWLASYDAERLGEVESMRISESNQHKVATKELPGCLTGIKLFGADSGKKEIKEIKASGNGSIEFKWMEDFDKLFLKWGLVQGGVRFIERYNCKLSCEGYLKFKLKQLKLLNQKPK